MRIEMDAAAIDLRRRQRPPPTSVHRQRSGKIISRRFLSASLCECVCRNFGLWSSAGPPRRSMRLFLRPLLFSGQKYANQVPFTIDSPGDPSSSTLPNFQKSSHVDQTKNVNNNQRLWWRLSWKWGTNLTPTLKNSRSSPNYSIVSYLVAYESQLLRLTVGQVW